MLENVCLSFEDVGGSLGETQYKKRLIVVQFSDHVIDPSLAGHLDNSETIVRL